MQRCYGCMKEFGKEYDVCPYCGYIVGTKPESKSHLLPGTMLLGRYTVGKAIGHGGFGITYIAWDNKIQKTVAVKEYFPNAFSARGEGETKVFCYNNDAETFLKQGIQKMLNEARSISDFSDNENIVDIYDYFEENNTAYIVMEHLEGRDLKQLLVENGGRLSPERAVEIINYVINALEDLHAQNLIHRDVSPDNIFICTNGRVKLLDFGSARLAVEDSSKSLSVTIKRGYAPREQYASRSKQGTWTDVYAVCATLYKMITGVTPDESTEREEAPLKGFAEFGLQGYENLENAVFNGLEVDYTNRTQTMAQLSRELKSQSVSRIECQPNKPENKPVPTGDKSKSKTKTKAIIIVACVVAALAVAVGAFFGIRALRNSRSRADEKVEVTTTLPVNDGIIDEEVLKAMNSDTLVVAIEGELNSKIKWALYSNGNLTISGNGDMPDYDYDAPWYVYSKQIKTVTIEDGVTSVGNCAFLCCENITGATIGDSVISIGDYAFDSCVKLESIMIPESVMTIGDQAFNSCTSLTGVTIPDSVTAIGDSVFSSCTGLTSVTIGNSITAIGDYAFDNCTSLKRITVASGNQNYSSDSAGVLFDKDKTELIRYPAGNSKYYYTIPDGVLTICESAFSNCNNLTEITISDSVKSIGNYAFFGCENLTYVITSEGLTSIGEGAFSSCESLISFEVPDGVTSISDFTFDGCESLESITLPDSVKSVGYYAFFGCQSLSVVYYPLVLGAVTDWTRIFFNTDEGNDYFLDAQIEFF